MRCKVGDLCWVTRTAYQENSGKIVKIIARSQYVEWDWYVESQGGPLRACWYDTNQLDTGMRIQAKDFQLIPIRPEPTMQPAPEQEVTV